MKHRLIHSTLFIVFCFVVFNTEAQDVSNYFLAPTGLILPVGEKIDIKIRWEDHSSSETFHEGTASFLTGGLPVWSIVSKSGAGTNKDEGSLSTTLSGMDAVYTAPDKIPSTNPVTVAVKFKANDSSKQEVTLLCTIEIVDPGQNWFFYFTATESSRETIKSSSEDFTKEVVSAGCGSLLIDAPPPEKNGYTIINTEQGDRILRQNVNGFYRFHEDDIHKGLFGNTESREIRNYVGSPNKNQGLLFEYDPTLKGFKGSIQGAGISYDLGATDEMWTKDVNTDQMKKYISKHLEKNYGWIGLGSNDDQVKRTKNGFTIEYSQSKDSTYTDFNGKHTLTMKKQYHAVLIRKNKNYNNK